MIDVEILITPTSFYMVYVLRFEIKKNPQEINLKGSSRTIFYSIIGSTFLPFLEPKSLPKNILLTPIQSFQAASM